jgi:hypothetical protein
MAITERVHSSLVLIVCLGILVPSAGWGQAQTQPQPPSLPTHDVKNIDELAAIIAERDRQYAQRFEAQQKAVDAALAAQDKATAAAFAAAEKAVVAALAAQEKASTAAFNAANTAVIKAETANEKRLDSVNEFRNQQKDTIALFPQKSEVDVRFSAMSAKIDEVAKRVTEMQSESRGANALWLIIAGILGLIVAVAVAGTALWRVRQRGEPT